MADQSPDQHPTIRNFKSKLDRQSATIADRNQLERFRNGPKCDPSQYPVIDALLRQYDDNTEALKAKQIADHQRVHAPASAPAASPAKGVNASAANPSALGEPFHNPYTFIPFGTKPTRRIPTLLTADESDSSRFTGLLRVRVRTLSPLLTCEPRAETGESHAILAIGDDVVVPATGVRGALRTLMTILTGGTLGYVDPTLWLTQGRDLNLGPRDQKGRSNAPERVFLARVLEPGTATRPGRLEVGEPIDADSPLLRPAAELGVGQDDARRPRQNQSRGVTQLAGATLRLSGRPINMRGKREACYKSSGIEITLAPELWGDYTGRHAHADFPELKAGDLVWLEPRASDLDRIRDGSDVASIQWSRWGRRGRRLLDDIRKHHPAVLPDASRTDGLVDEVTDLFGQVPDAKVPTAAPAFAGRVRPDNLVFRGAARGSVHRGVQLAPLMQPHPGCLGFYRSNRDLDQISQEDPLRGYKVYRTTSERGSAAPWHYATQGTYDEYGALQPPGPVSRNCDLLHEGVEGELTLSLRSLSRREIALLLATCSVDWRLGGGKPLGLGHCRVTHLELLDEFGETRLELDLSCSTTLDRASPAEIPSAYASEIDAELAARLRHYQATQRPVPKLRYPRAAKPNRNKTNRGGQVWFQRHASPRKGEDRSQQPLPGLQVLRVTEELAARVGNSQIQAQRLPDFDPEKPLADVLYGYDCLTDDDDGARGGVPSARGIAPFDPTRHSRPTDRSGGHQGQSRETRRGQRGDR